MDNRILPTLILTITVASVATISMAVHCPDCGQNPVPYPLSTGPSCGDHAYRVRCDAGTLWFDTLNQSSYTITSTNPLTRRMILRPPGFGRHNGSCTSADIQSHGMWLDEGLPFSITTSNIVIKMNCSQEVLHEFDFICNSTGICEDYIRDNKEAANACAVKSSSNICCSYRAGQSVNAHSIRAYPGRCTMYESFVDLDPMLPVNKWPEPGVEIEWAMPLEPMCKSPQDCKELRDSTCLSDPVKDRQMRCFCKAGYRWDPIHGECYHKKCRFGEFDERCEVPDTIEGIGFVAVIMLLIVVIMYIIKRQCMQIGSHVKLEKIPADSNCEQQVETK